jgi:hypothetical protein
VKLRVWDRVSVKRVFGATAGLALSGGIVGGVLGAGLLGLLGILLPDPGSFPHVWQVYALAAEVGAIVGSVGLPLVTWTLLRRVAFGRVLLGTALGTAMGGTAGLLASHIDPTRAVQGAIAGFCAAAITLRLLEYRASRAKHAPSE